ncbi:hypothetical protein [Myxococcus sp. RHSTA-1-4]|uniref:hypothetical protein n=1 Tax=Myxococcus sp. RHSTA-1-4 TaxID=2874601 RepID=UPI002104C60A|nr:hypothetical protein [Myxococcus sp. RHSTA-1-4]
MASPYGQAPAPAARPTPGATGGATASTSSTQIFGGGRPGTMSTQIFGSGPHPNPAAGASAPVPNTTQTFGAVPPPPSIPPVSMTQTFGAVPPPGSAAPGNATQSFGAVPPQGSAAPGNATQTFGAVPAHGSTSPGNTTQTFGAVPAHGPTSPGNTTQTFGAVPAQDAPAPIGRAQTFGAVPAPDSPAPIGRAQTFGAVLAQGDAAPVGSTRVFGVAPVSPPTNGDTPLLPGVFTSRAPSTSIGRTQSFGAVPSEPSQGPAGQGPGIGRTALFGATGSSSGEDTGIQLPPESPPPVGSETLVPLGPGAQGGVEPVPAIVTPSRRPPVELPPELLAAGRESSMGGGFDSGQPKRQRLLLTLAVAAGLVLTAVLAYPAWRDRNSDMPVAAVEDKDRAAALLRRDDPASREQAIQRLRALNAAHPKYTEAQAELVVALSLRLSDLQADAERLRTRVDRLNREKLDARELRDPVERDLRIASLDKDLADIAREAAPLRGEADTLRKELDSQVPGLANAPEVEPAPALVARLKARAIHAGVTVAPDALALAERLRNVEGTSRAWSTLSRAEYALNSGSPPDSLAEVSKELDTLRQEDRTLLRAYVLGARVALRLNDPSTARSLLDDALALNPNHQLASKLLSQLGTAARRP